MGSCVGTPALPAKTALGSLGVTEADDDCVVVEASEEKTAAVIVLHGLGDRGASFKEVVMDYGGFRSDHALDGVKWIFPTAEMRSITVNRGARMNGWFDIHHFDDLQAPAADPAGIRKSIHRIKRLISLEVASGLPYDHIGVMGISQGGHVALKLALQAQPPLTACVALSTWLEPLQDQVQRADGKTRFFIGYGTQDLLIPIEQASFVRDNLGRSGFDSVEIREYKELAHWMCPEELIAVASFLKTAFPLHATGL